VVAPLVTLELRCEIDGAFAAEVDAARVSAGAPQVDESRVLPQKKKAEGERRYLPAHVLPSVFGRAARQLAVTHFA